MKIMGKIQIGKQGVTDNFISTLGNHFINHRNMKVSVLKKCRKREYKKIFRRNS